jgi:hypothetical protein
MTGFGSQQSERSLLGLCLVSASIRFNSHGSINLCLDDRRLGFASAFLPVPLEFATVLVEYHGVLEQVLRIVRVFGDYDHPQGDVSGSLD